MSFHVPEELRDIKYSSKKDGNNGVFWVPAESSRNVLKIISSDGMGWDHVSVSKKYSTPTWEEMCKIKGLFWDDYDCVIQYHPPKKDYVNNHPHCLHLWKAQKYDQPRPPTYMVGIK